MRDVILVKVGKSVKVSKPTDRALRQPAGRRNSRASEIPVTRGWASIDAQVNGGQKLHFVDTHFESFDPATEVPSIRSKQASELLAGPLKSNLPTILVGDLNSDDDTVEAGRPAGLPDAARRRHARAQHQQAARLLPQLEPARRNRAAATSPTSTTRSTT